MNAVGGSQLGLFVLTCLHIRLYTQTVTPTEWASLDLLQMQKILLYYLFASVLFFLSYFLISLPPPPPSPTTWIHIIVRYITVNSSTSLWCWYSPEAGSLSGLKSREWEITNLAGKVQNCLNHEDRLIKTPLAPVQGRLGTRPSNISAWVTENFICTLHFFFLNLNLISEVLDKQAIVVYM